MGKRIVRWELSTDKTILKLGKPLEDPKADMVIEVEFDLTELFKDFSTLSDTQQQLIIYGTKQKLMDVGSGIADEGGKISAAKKKWNELLEGKWTGERVNSTGAAETKKAISGLKEQAKAVTLQGLMLKKAMSSFPGQPAFTDEDEAKLQEFIELAAKAGKKGK